MLSRRGPISPLPAGSPRRRRLPGGGTCEHRAKEETAEPGAACGDGSGSAASPPAVALGSEGAPAAPPRGTRGAAARRRSGGASGSPSSPAAGHSCLAPLSAAPTRSPATSRSQRPSLLSRARPTAGRLRLIRSVASPEGSPLFFCTRFGIGRGCKLEGEREKSCEIRWPRWRKRESHPPRSLSLCDL